MADVRITHIGGPTTLIEVDGVRLLTDPTFDAPGRRYSFGWGSASRKTTGPAVAVAELPPIVAVLLSHDHHGDNLDDAGRALLPAAGVVLTTAAGARRLGGNAVGLTPWQTTTIVGGVATGPSVAVTATPARHGPPLSRPVAGDVVGFALAWPGQPHGVLWISGDTVLHDGVRQVAERLTVDTAVLHLGAVRFGITGPVRYTMTAREAVDLCALLRPRTVLPVHYEAGVISAKAARPSRTRSRRHPKRSARACAGSRWAGPSPSDQFMPTLPERAGPASTQDRSFVSQLNAQRHQQRGQSLTLAHATDPEAEILIAYEMNGEPLNPDHGAPFRLIVPRWYGVASVKWLKHVDVLTEPYVGEFETGHYMYEWADRPHEPVR